MARYYVLNENTFGYAENESDKGSGRFFGIIVMAVDVSKGGDPTFLGRVALADKLRTRVALDSDAKRFGIII